MGWVERMDILLLRIADTHSAADETLADAERAALSERGRKQTRRMAVWLQARSIRDLHVYISQAPAAREMAAAVAPRPLHIKSLGREPRPLDVLAATGWPQGEGSALVIARRETLEPLAGLLLTGLETPLTIKKGGLWWLTHRTRAGERQTVLRVALSPDLLRD